jgi:hypothetical protein
MNNDERATGSSEAPEELSVWTQLAAIPSDTLAARVNELDRRIEELVPRMHAAARDGSPEFNGLLGQHAELSGERILLIEEQIVRGEARGTARPFRYGFQPKTDD